MHIWPITCGDQSMDRSAFSFQDRFGTHIQTLGMEGLDEVKYSGSMGTPEGVSLLETLAGRSFYIEFLCDGRQPCKRSQHLYASSKHPRLFNDTTHNFTCMGEPETCIHLRLFFIGGPYRPHCFFLLTLQDHHTSVFHLFLSFFIFFSSSLISGIGLVVLSERKKWDINVLQRENSVKRGRGERVDLAG